MNNATIYTSPESHCTVC